MYADTATYFYDYLRRPKWDFFGLLNFVNFLEENFWRKH